MRALTLFACFAFSIAGAFAQSASATPSASLGNVELAQIQTIYIMPMANGFDQYLANRLRSIPNFRIVTDPSKADAFFTDRLGAGFETKLEEYENTAAAKEKEKEMTQSGQDPSSLPVSQQGLKLAPKMISSIGRGKGNYFIVDKRSRIVLWSIFEKAKDPMPKTLDRSADHIIDVLRKDLTGKK